MADRKPKGTLELSHILQTTLTNVNSRFKSKFTSKQLVMFLSKNRVHIKDANFNVEFTNLEKLLPIRS